MEKQLIVRPEPKPDESLIGYVLRLTDANCYHSPKYILEYCGVTPFLMISEGGLFVEKNLDLGRLSTLTQVDIERLRGLVLLASEKTDEPASMQVFGQPVSSRLLRSRPSKICPSCLKESGYLRRIWQIVPFTVCLNHLCRLIDVCPECDRDMTWVRPKVTRCTCGYNLIDAKTEHVDASSVRTIKTVLDGESERITASQLINASPLLAQEYFLNDCGGIKKTVLNLRCEKSHKYFMKAFCALIRFPDGFISFLDWLRSVDKRLNPTSTTYRNFRAFQSKLYSRHHVGIEVLRERYEKYLEEIKKSAGNTTNHRG